eukprot:6480353-Prymnesium_polylepis.2
MGRPQSESRFRLPGPGDNHTTTKSAEWIFSRENGVSIENWAHLPNLEEAPHSAEHQRLREWVEHQHDAASGNQRPPELFCSLLAVHYVLILIEDVDPVKVLRRTPRLLRGEVPLQARKVDARLKGVPRLIFTNLCGQGTSHSSTKNAPRCFVGRTSGFASRT